MNTYPTYQAAKIAMPKACIVKYKYGGNYRFTGMPTREGTTLCNGSEFAEPQDHCMTVKQFLEDGHELEIGDIVINSVGRVVCMTSRYSLSDFGVLNSGSHKEYILRAKALEETNAIPTETPEANKAREAVENLHDASQQAESLALRETLAHETLDKSVDEQLKAYRYEKVTDSIFDLNVEFERGDLFSFDGSENYVQIETEGDFSYAHVHENLHRRIEVTERELEIEEMTARLCGVAIPIEASKLASKLHELGFGLVNGKG